MRKKYFYSKNRSGEATTAAATAAGGGINLRILLKRSVQETTPTM